MNYSFSPLEAAAAVALAQQQNMALRMFRPQPHQDEVFQKNRPMFTLILGGNRSGKSTTAAVLFAAVATDTPITLSTGEVVEARTPAQKGKCLKMWVVGYDQKHIGQTIYDLLMRPKLFWTTRDPVSKKLRAYNPDTDQGLKKIPSPPLIPKQYVKSISWEIASANVFSKITLHNPATQEPIAEIFAYTSKGEPKQGDAVDGLIWIDEAVARDGYVAELRARLVDHDSQLVWSSWPDHRSDELAQFNEMVDKEIESGSGLARKVVLTMTGNKHLSKKTVQKFLAGCNSQEEIEARDKGKFVTESLRMYPLFDKHYHIAYGQDPEQDDALAKLLRRTDGIPPNDWTKYLIVDPGTNAPAALLCSVPPTELGDYVVPYQEFYPGRADAVQLAALIKREMPNEKYYQFIIDHRASRQTPMGFGSTIKAEYERAFKLAGLTCHTSLNMFTPGCDDVGGRQMVINGWLHPGKTGYPKLRIVQHRCPKLIEQLTKIKKKVIQKEVKDERKQDGQPSDVADALAYFAGAHPRYIYIKPTLEDASPAFQRYMKRFGQKQESKSGFSIGTYY